MSTLSTRSGTSAIENTEKKKNKILPTLILTGASLFNIACGGDDPIDNPTPPTPINKAPKIEVVADDTEITLSLKDISKEKIIAAIKQWLLDNKKITDESPSTVKVILETNIDALLSNPQVGSFPITFHILDNKGLKSNTQSINLSLTQEAITSITPPIFSDDIQIGQSINLLADIHPTEATVSNVMIGDEVVTITDPLNFSPQFPGTYTISYSYTNKQGKVISASTKCIFKSIDSPVEQTFTKYTLGNIDDEGYVNPYRYKLLEKYGVFNHQLLGIDLLEYGGFKTLSQAEARKRILSITPMIFDKSIGDDEHSLDGGKILIDQENSRNYALNNKDIFSEDRGGDSHPADVTSTGFGYNNAPVDNINGVGSGGHIFEHLQKNYSHNGVILLTDNHSSTVGSDQVAKFISKIQARPDKNFIIFRPNSRDFDLYTTEHLDEKQKLIDNLHTLANLPNVIVCIAGTDDSNNGTIVSEDETPGTGEYQTFPASVHGIWGASSSTGQGTQLLYKMPTTSEKVITFVAKYPTGGSSSRSTGDIAGETYSIATTYPHKNNQEIRAIMLNKKNHFPITTQKETPATELAINYNLVPIHELLPNGLPQQINLGEKKTLFPDNQWIKEDPKFLVAQGDLVRYDETTKTYLLDTKIFAQRGGFTNSDGSLKQQATTTIHIYIPKQGEQGKYLFSTELKITVQR